MSRNTLNTLKDFNIAAGKKGKFYSLPALEKSLGINVSRLPVSIRVVLESVLRNCDGKKVTEEHIKQLASWAPTGDRTDEIPFVVARVVLQDFTGVPLLADLAAMRNVAHKMGIDSKKIEPLVPVDLVVDHSVTIDHFREPKALDLNMKLEFSRNNERYQFMKWGMQAFDTFGVVPPGFGIVHQVNLEYLARGVHKTKDGVYYPDSLVGTDSHTTMINGVGVVGWGVGGIEAEAGMLGQPVYFLTPDVIGVNLTGVLREGCTATDLVLTITELLRKEKVVGKFVEFFGAGTETLSLTDRATIANMAPEYGATMGFFPVDDATIEYFEGTGRTKAEIDAFAGYFKAQGLYGVPKAGDIDYTRVVELNLSSVTPSLAGPKRPQDRIEIGNVKNNFTELFSKPTTENGFNKKAEDLTTTYTTTDGVHVKNGDVLIAAITSCTNTSNPSVMLAAGLLAKKAVERGLTVNSTVKSSLEPGSRVVTDYLNKTGLSPYLDKLGFQTVGYGCTTCIGNSGPLHPAIEDAIVKNDLVAASVLSGNRNFEARVHQNIKANFLMSPPLVVAFALAGRVNIDLTREPIGDGKDGQPVYLKDLWPTLKEVRDLMKSALSPALFRRLYSDFASQNPKWNEIPSKTGDVYEWDRKSTYIQEPPFFTSFSLQPGSIAEIKNARALAIFGDSVTTDHISPAGSIKKTSPAGKYLIENGVTAEDFNSYGSRRGNDRVMTRGTFANVRIKNLMVPGVEGGVTKFQPDGEQLSIYDAAIKYQAAKIPLVVIAGQEYGTGSSRDWAAKGTNLLGVKAVIAESFERIHRSNLVGMGVLPLQFKEGTTGQTLKLDGSESYSVLGLTSGLKPQQDLTLRIVRQGGEALEVPVRCRIDTPIEIEYYQHGGILPFVLRQIVARS